jgi:hypothetical protein
MNILSDIDNTLLDTLRAAVEHSDVFLSKCGLDIDWFISKDNPKLYLNDVITLTQIATNKKYRLESTLKLIKSIDVTVTLITSRHSVDEYVLKYIFSDLKIDDILVDYSWKEKIDFVNKNKPRYYFEDDPRVFTNLNPLKTRLFIHVHRYNKKDAYAMRSVNLI